MRNVYLPGDRELYELARVTARDSRPTEQERVVAYSTTMCLHYKAWAYDWCLPGDPCPYCVKIRRITNGQ